MIRAATAADAEALATIYNHYIEHTVVTFEEEPVAGAEIQRRIAAVEAAGLPWLVVEDEGTVVGYAYAAPWKGRSAYRHTVEVSIYLWDGARGRGLGTALYRALFEALRPGAVHMVIGGMTLPNPGSQALHERFGMVKVAHFKEVGFKFGRWLDVGYWQARLDALVLPEDPDEAEAHGFGARRIRHG